MFEQLDEVTRSSHQLRMKGWQFTIPRTGGRCFDVLLALRLQLLTKFLSRYLKLSRLLKTTLQVVNP